MLDASVNRAREGLRVLEDAGRFGLDNPGLTERLKAIRHGVRTGLAGLPIREADLLASRDTTGDVGTDITAPSESDRAGLGEVVAAAAKRTQEALRSIEECAKALGADASVFERARYAAYELERDIGLALMPPCPQWELCVLVTASMCRDFVPDEVIRRAAEGGADCIQIREKEMDDGKLVEHACRMTEVCQSVGVHVVINDRVDVARLCNADGVHLGQNDLPVAAARGILGAGRWIGVSCSTPEHAQQAVRDGADSVGLGPMFVSSTKPKDSLPGPALLEAVLGDPATKSVPHLAISGISDQNAGVLGALGCRGVAVSSAVCGSEDPAKACRSIRASLAGRDATIDA